LPSSPDALAPVLVVNSIPSDLPMKERLPMLTLFGPGQRFCDGISRRCFLSIGGLAVGGLSLPALLRAEEKAGKGRSSKAVIMVYLSGGLAHQDTFDLKPSAPAEVRGEF